MISNQPNERTDERTLSEERIYRRQIKTLKTKEKASKLKPRDAWGVFFGVLFREIEEHGEKRKKNDLRH